MSLLILEGDYAFVPVAPAPGAGEVSTPQSFSGSGDMLLDPVTLDYVRTANGEWQQTFDSRTIMLIRLSVRLGKSAFDPGHGTAIADLLESGDLSSVEVLESETIRVGNELRDEGVLSGLVVTVRDSDGNPIVDDKGRNIVKTQWQDLASGNPIDETYTPR